MEAQIFIPHNLINFMKYTKHKTTKLSLLLMLLLYQLGVMAQNQQVYLIPQHQLTGATNNGCNANNPYGDNIGFAWVDTLPAGTQLTGLTVEYNIGVNCGNTTSTPTLNAILQTSVTFTEACTCTPNSAQQKYITHTLNPSNYNVGAANNYRLPGTTTLGFNNQPASLQGNFAKVTVTYGAPNDAGIAAINLPASFCAQTRNIEVQLKNFGTNAINSVNINWNINGTPQTPIAYNITLSPNAEVTIVLASNYNFLDGQTYTINASTSLPNGVTDSNATNDATTKSMQIGAFPPTNLANTVVTSGSSYAISWSGDSAQLHELEYGASGFALGSGTTISNITGLSRTVNGINPNINGYDLYVRSYCGSTPSAWSAVYSFGIVPLRVSNQTELDAALASVANDGVIVFTNNIVVTGAKTVNNKRITIDGQGYELSVPRPGLDNSGRINTSPSLFRLFTFAGTQPIKLRNLTLKGGSFNSGGAINNGAGTPLTLENCIISNSLSSNGGGGIANSGILYCSNSFLRRNAANFGGGIINLNGGVAYFESSTLVENRSISSSGGGGAVEAQSGSTIYFNNSTLSNNQSTEIGGAINCYQGTVYFINSSATGNVAFGSFTGGAIGNNNGNVYILNSLFAHNYARTSGDVSNPTGFILDDFARFPSGIRVYHSIYQAALPAGLAVNTSNIQYTGAANGSNNTIFSGGLLSRITDNNGNEIGDQVYRPFLFNNQGSVAPTLQSGSFISQIANRGTSTRFSNGNNIPRIGYFDNSAWVNLVGTPTTQDLVIKDQVGDTRGASPARGAIESEIAGSLFILKVNGSVDGTVNGGTLFGDVYPSGTNVTLTAIPNTSRVFSRWDFVSGGTGVASTSNPYTLNLTQNITLLPVFSTVAAGSYSITYIGNGQTSGTGPSVASFSSNTTIQVAGDLVKNGFTFTAWNTSSNGSGTSYAPGASYTAGNNLTLYAQWQEIPPHIWTGTTSSDWNIASNWNVSSVPTAAAIVIIPVRPNQPISSSAIEVTEITLNTGAIFTMQSTNVLKVNGRLINDGSLIFKSNINGSAIFDVFNGTISGIGTVTTERFIPAKRAFRFLSPSVTTTSSINANWQENAGTAANLGTHITGNGGATNGFDASTTNNPSLFTYTSGSWQAVTNTNTNTLTAGTGYRLMVRGDRTLDLTTNTPTPTPTVLRATGTLKTGNQSAVINQTADGFSFVGNPYQAPVNMKEVINASTNMNTGFVYYWDPTINARGGYITRNLSANTNDVTSSFNEFVQPGQAVFVKKLNNANSATLTFTEANKAVGNANAGLFRTNATSSNNLSALRLKLKTTIDNQLQEVEGALALFDASYSWDVNEQDATKMSNLDEQVSFKINNQNIAIASQSIPLIANELPIDLRNFRQADYQWYFELENYNGATPYLFDTQNQSYTEIENGTSYNFSVNVQSPPSYAERFKVVFANNTLSNPSFGATIVLYPNPAVKGSNQFFMEGVESTAKVTIHNLLAQPIAIQTTEQANGLQVQALETVATGIYVVTITTATTKTQVKWIVK